MDALRGKLLETKDSALSTRVHLEIAVVERDVPRPEGSNLAVVGTWPPRVEPPTNSGFDARISGADRRFQINFIARGDWFLVPGTIGTISMNGACESCAGSARGPI